MRIRSLRLLASLAIAAGVAYYAYSHGPWGDAAKKDGTLPNSPVAALGPGDSVVAVEVVSLGEGSVSSPIEMLGTVTPLGGATVSHALPGDVTVIRVLVSVGQHVALNAPVLEVQSTPALRAQIRVAEQNLQAEKASLTVTRERVNSRLGTRSELLAVERTLRTAELELQGLSELSPATDGLLRSRAAGTVTAVLVSEGETAARGTVLFQVVPDDSIAVRFGVPRAALGKLSSGDVVEAMDLLSQGEHLTSLTVDRIDLSVNPITRTMTAWTHPVDPLDWIPGTPVRVTAKLKSPAGWVVPRSAIVLQRGLAGIYTVADRRATHHEVIIMGEDATSVCIQSDGLTSGEPVVVVGANELSDQALVKIEPRP